MRVLFAGLILSLLFIGFYSQSSAKTLCLNEPDVAVISNDSADIHRVCSASEEAIEFLHQYGLRLKRQIVVEIIEKGIYRQGYHAYATYDSRRDRIQIMSYRSILYGFEEPIMYDEFFDLEHYNGAIAHEIAHAVFHHNAKSHSPGTAPQEYLAHAVQLGVLPDDKREDIIAKMDVSPWLPGDAISDVYMALEPGKFAVKSYKHLTTCNDPHGFIQILLNSKWFYVYIP